MCVCRILIWITSLLPCGKQRVAQQFFVLLTFLFSQLIFSEVIDWRVTWCSALVTRLWLKHLMAIHASYLMTVSNFAHVFMLSPLERYQRHCVLGLSMWVSVCVYDYVLKVSALWEAFSHQTTKSQCGEAIASTTEFSLLLAYGRKSIPKLPNKQSKAQTNYEFTFHHCRKRYQLQYKSIALHFT